MKFVLLFVVVLILTGCGNTSYCIKGEVGYDDKSAGLSWCHNPQASQDQGRTTLTNEKGENGIIIGEEDMQKATDLITKLKDKVSELLGKSVNPSAVPPPVSRKPIRSLKYGDFKEAISQ